MSLPKLGNKVLHQRVYETLKNSIISLQFAPGEELNEGLLAEQMGVSKTPVRAALLQLEKEGLVIHEPFRGIYVSPITSKDITDILLLREIIESYACSFMAKHITPAELNQLEIYLKEMAQALEEKDFQKQGILGRKFHRFIVDKLNSQRVSSIYQNIDGHIKRLTIFFRSYEDKKSFFSDHEKLVEAFRRRDSKLAEACIREHLRNVSLKLRKRAEKMNLNMKNLKAGSMHNINKKK